MNIFYTTVNMNDALTINTQLIEKKQTSQVLGDVLFALVFVLKSAKHIQPDYFQH